jgi:hypothetical protein
MDDQKLEAAAKKVLAFNDLGTSTRPAAGLYPHQWLWDSCFIAIGLRHLSIARAQQEIRSLLKGQWKNGMLPYIIFGDARDYHAGPDFWQSQRSPDCPKNVQSTGGTQPPVVAEAVVRIGQLLSTKERKAWYAEVYPALAAYHEWLYRERDPKHTGLVVLFHSWETGLDNNLAWMDTLHRYALSKRLWLVDKSAAMARFLERFRKDTTVVPAAERMSTLDLLAFYDQAKQMRQLKYDNYAIYKKSKLLIQDVNMNAILVRNTHLLGQIAKDINAPLPVLTAKAYKRGTAVLEQLWDEQTGYYYNRDVHTGQLITIPTVASFMPLYAGRLPKARVMRLVQHLQDPQTFGAGIPIPSAPLHAPGFKPTCYWQGPSWVNTNWLIMTGLRLNRQADLAATLKADTLAMVKKGGMYEYFSPLDATPAGAPNFSWTAALTLELLHETPAHG